MFDILCGCNGQEREGIIAWFRGLSPEEKADVMAKIDVVKSAGLNSDTALPMLDSRFEPHVVEYSRHYFLLARNITDNKVIVLGCTKMSQGPKYASEQAIAATKHYFAGRST